MELISRLLMFFIGLGVPYALLANTAYASRSFKFVAAGAKFSSLDEFFLRFVTKKSMWRAHATDCFMPEKLKTFASIHDKNSDLTSRFENMRVFVDLMDENEKMQKAYYSKQTSRFMRSVQYRLGRFMIQGCRAK